MTGRSDESVPTPGTLRTAVVVVGVEALGVLAYVVFLGYESVVTKARGGPQITILFGLFAAAFALLCWALARRKAWARGPAVVLQLFLLAIGYYMVRGGLAWLGVPVGLMALVCVGLLLASRTRDALGVK